jgi:hypothetical protein
MVDMSNEGCFEPGVTGTTDAAANAQFAEGQGLMFPSLTVSKGSIDAADPQFRYLAPPVSRRHRRAPDADFSSAG